jgi:hypothetical protein
MDYLALNVGDEDPNLKRRITVLIDKGIGHIVYLDEELNIQAAYAKELDKDSGSVMNRITDLECLMGFMQQSEKPTQEEKKCIVRIKNLLGEAFVRSYAGKDIISATRALDDAEVQIRRWNQEVSIRWYFCSALACSIVFMTLLIMVLVYRTSLITTLSENAVAIVAVGLLGSLGAFTSICLRHRQIILDANAGFAMHMIEACARIVVGVIAALVMILMVKGGLLLELVEMSPVGSKSPTSGRIKITHPGGRLCRLF